MLCHQCTRRGAEGQPALSTDCVPKAVTTFLICKRARCHGETYTSGSHTTTPGWSCVGTHQAGGVMLAGCQQLRVTVNLSRRSCGVQEDRTTRHNCSHSTSCGSLFIGRALVFSTYPTHSLVYTHSLIQQMTIQLASLSDAVLGTKQ